MVSEHHGFLRVSRFGKYRTSSSNVVFDVHNLCFSLCNRIHQNLAKVHRRGYLTGLRVQRGPLSLHRFPLDFGLKSPRYPLHNLHTFQYAIFSHLAHFPNLRLPDSPFSREETTLGPSYKC